MHLMVHVFKRLLENGVPIFYEPEAVVSHKVEEERLSKDFLRRWFWDVGKTLGHQIAWKRHFIFTIAPLWLWQELLFSFMRWIKVRFALASNEAERFASEVWVRHYSGIFLERFFHWLPFNLGVKKCVFKEEGKK